MKSSTAFALVANLFCLWALAEGKEEEYCANNVRSACSASTFSAKSICNARFSGIKHLEQELQAYLNSQLTKSYEYLLLATYFNSYQKNRLGFQSLYQQLSDRSYNNTVELIKFITRRGGIVDFNTKYESPAAVSRDFPVVEVDELSSLALALDSEKQLANGASHIHSRASHLPAERDPEVAHYIERKFLRKQAESVRQISGYANDLAKLMKVPDPSLALYMFDGYLQEQLGDEAAPSLTLKSH